MDHERKMQAAAAVLIFGIGMATGIFAQSVVSYDLTQRKEHNRTDLSGAPGMEVIASVVEATKGESIALHHHHGVETGYVIQGSMIQVPGKEPVELKTGLVSVNLRDVDHAGFKVVGDTPLRIFTVHVVDKGKPLYDWAK